MKRSKVILIILLLLFLFSICLIQDENKSMSINAVLSTNHYSYLPEKAKEFIQYTYLTTGEILKTEKNKVPNKPYLNPEYVIYLSSTQEEQKEYNVIPEKTIIDYLYSNTKYLLKAENIPSSFDLRNVNGNNYTTPVKNQGGLGLCWAFGTIGQIESLLLLKNNQTYSTNAERFSERQIDYATADDGLTDNKPLYEYNRILGDGGTFQYATSVMADGLGLADTSWKIYDDDDYESMEMNEVYNFSNSKYEVTGTITYPNLNLSDLDQNNEDDILLRENYLNNLKSIIMQYGGAYIGTVDPTGYCSISLNGSRFMYDDSKCASAGHAMQIIGWDDNYEYSICTGTKNASGYVHINSDVANCTGGTVITGKGAWLLKNSWGSSSPYVYIAYDSRDMRINITTELGQKNWDNYYSSRNKMYNSYVSTTTQQYTKKSNNKEQINKIKFTTTTQNANYDIYVATNDNKKFQLYKTITSEFPGLYTVDLTSSNIVLEDGSFYIKVVSSDGQVSKSISVYTNNLETTPIATTSDSIYENSLTNINKYMIRVSSDTVAIPEHSQIEYKILDQNNTEITADYTYTNNVVFANQIFSKIMIEPTLSKGTYRVQTIYNNQVLSTSNVIIDKSVITIEGKGLEDDPYIITTPAQLGLIKYDAFAFYKLANDIDLTYDTTNENGLYYNNGLGWEPIKYSSITTGMDNVYTSNGFSGGFDGDNHKIIGLTINRPNESVVGLFANTYNLNFSNLHIKNIILENPNIIGKDYVGGIVGYINGTTYERNLNISNISIHGGSIKGNNNVGGVIGYLRAGSYLKNYYVGGERHKIDNLYNDATIEANNYAGGIIGFATNITGYKEGNSIFQITNILNKGKIVSDNSASGLIGKIKTAQNNYISVYNAMNTGEITGQSCSAGIVCELEDDSVGELKLSNIYYIDELGINLSNSYIKTDNVSTKTLEELKTSSSYVDWIDFDINWSIENINNVNRLPVLKGSNFNYTNITLEDNYSLSSAIVLSDYIIPNTEAAKNIKYRIEDTSIISINSYGKLTPLSTGTTKLHLESYYDGFIATITINALKLKNITSTTYTIDSNKKLIYLLEPISVERFYSNINNNTGSIMDNEKILEKGNVGTGMTIDNYTIILRGDVTGDGFIRVNDVMKISKYTVEGIGLEQEYNFLAADVTNDSLVKVNDVMKISKYTVEGGNI